MGEIIPLKRGKSAGISETNNRPIYEFLLGIESAGKITKEAINCILKSFADKELEEVSREKAEEAFSMTGFDYHEIAGRALDFDREEIIEAIASLELELALSSIFNEEEKERAREIHGRIISLFID